MGKSCPTGYSYWELQSDLCSLQAPALLGYLTHTRCNLSWGAGCNGEGDWQESSSGDGVENVPLNLDCARDAAAAGTGSLHVESQRRSGTQKEWAVMEQGPLRRVGAALTRMELSQRLS